MCVGDGVAVILFLFIFCFVFVVVFVCEYFVCFEFVCVFVVVVVVLDGLPLPLADLRLMLRLMPLLTNLRKGLNLSNRA